MIDDNKHWMLKEQIDGRQLQGLLILIETAGMVFYNSIIDPSEVLAGKGYLGWNYVDQICTYQYSPIAGDVLVTYGELLEYLHYKIKNRETHENTINVIDNKFGSL